MLLFLFHSRVPNFISISDEKIILGDINFIHLLIDIKRKYATCGRRDDFANICQ